MSRPDVGEYFISQRDTVCIMVEVDMFVDFSLSRLPLMYIEGSPYSMKRKATDEEIVAKQVITIKEKEMESSFHITLESGHDTTIGLELLESKYIEHVFKLVRFNQSKAAERLGISRGTLRTKLVTYFGDKYIKE